MYIGIDDKGNLVGVEKAKKLAEDIPNKIVSLMGIVPDVNIHKKSGLEYLEIVVKPSNVAISLNGAYHYRSGATKQELRGTALQQFILKKLGMTWDDIVCKGATLKDIDRKQRIEPLEIPEDALREAIFNSVVHKDYSGAAIQMKVYADRILLWNEGNLPEGFTMDDLLGEHTSRPRNKNIANAFYRAGFIESWGRGIQKIKAGFETAGLASPSFQATMGGMMVSIWRGRDLHEKTREKTREKIREKIVRLIQEDPTITTNQLAESLEVSVKGVEWQLNSLKRDNVIKRVGPDKGGHWEVLGKGK